MSSDNTVPEPWRVRRDSVNAPTLWFTGPWRVETPRGYTMFRAHSQRTAYQLAVCMSSVEGLLARVNRIEQRPALSLIGGRR